jgi:DNA-binding CsgD family transcriptional regulator
MLLDRRAEKDELDRVLGAVREGLSGVLVLRGEAGIGKTMLLEYAVESAADMQVARSVGIESEMELGFAGLHQLLVPFLAGIERLPGPQRHALGSALGLVDHVPVDRFLVGLGVLTLLADAATDRPLLCVVDDAHWLDQASTEALGFVARRLFADRVAILFGLREPAERRVGLDGLSEMHIGGLPQREARELLASVATGRLDKRVGDRVVSETGGNPLALLELGVELTPGELSGGSRLPEPLPLGGRLEERFLARVRMLPADAQTLLLLAAAEPSGDPALLWRAAEGLGLGREAEELAAFDRLLVFTPRVAFRHPLMRSAVYQGASPSARRRVHGVLAVASDRELDADRRAWHLATATVSPDEQVASELESSADRARRRGGWAAAAACLTRAADLTPDEHRRAVRRLHAGQAELAGGTPAVAAGLLEHAMPWLSDPLDRAEAKRLEARVRFAGGECRAIPGMLLEAARALTAIDVTRARETLIEALSASFFAGHYAGDARTSEIARAARGTPRPPEGPESSSDLLLDGVALLHHDYGAGVRLLKRALEGLLEDGAAGTEAPRFTDLGCMVAGELRDDEAMQSLTSRVLGLARARGDLMATIVALAFQVLTEVHAGRLGAGEAALAEGREISAATGNVGVFGSAGIIELMILTWRGDERPAREAAAAVTREVTGRGMGGHLNYVRAFMIVLELAHGNYQAASNTGQTVYEEDPFWFGTSILPDLIEAAVRSGERGLAAAAAERLSDRAPASGTALAHGLLARSLALLADDRDAERYYIEAIDHLRRSRTAPESARARLLYGEWLRRRGRRRDARNELRRAQEMFDAMRIGAFAERARIELLATGEHARQRKVETCDELTAQEAQIARLASDGHSNREIAAQLFISPSTVAYHLRKIFRKLDVNTRTRLRRALVDEVQPQEPTAIQVP